MPAFAGACVAGLPWVPEIDMQPRLVLALFIAPAQLDGAYDLPPAQTCGAIGCHRHGSHLLQSC